MLLQIFLILIVGAVAWTIAYNAWRNRSPRPVLDIAQGTRPVRNVVPLQRPVVVRRRQSLREWLIKQAA